MPHERPRAIALRRSTPPSKAEKIGKPSKDRPGTARLTLNETGETRNGPPIPRRASSSPSAAHGGLPAGPRTRMGTRDMEVEDPPRSTRQAGDARPGRLRLAVISTPRSGNTWLRGLLASIFGLEERAALTPDDVDWSALPERCV